MIAATSTLQLATPTLIMIGLVAVTWFLSRKAKKHFGLGQGTVAPTSLKVVGKRQLEQKKSLYVVEIADRYVLVGTSDNSVALIDHITAEEFAAMATPVVEKPAAPTGSLSRRFNVLRPAAAAGTAAVAEDVMDAAADVALSSVDGDAADTEIDEPRFATVGESFQMLLGKARAARSGRATTAADTAELTDQETA